MAEAPHVAVVGAGIVGLSTAHALAELGERCRIYERGVPGHGQSGGDARIFRHGHDDPRLAELARASRVVWAEWEEALGLELVSADGVVALGQAAIERLRILEQVGGVRARPIEEDEVRDRLPLLSGFSGPAAFDEAGGAIRARAAIESLADKFRDSLFPDEVMSVGATERGTIEVRTGGDTSEYRSVIVCAGRGTAPLARGVGLSLPLALSAHFRATFDVRGERRDRIACLQDGSGDFGETGVYAAPLAGNGRYAVGLSETIDVQEDGSLVDPSALSALSERVRAYVQRALPDLDPEPAEVRHCWVTEVPWNDDGLAVWEQDGLFFVGGHNLFKMAPALGRALARAALGEELESRLRPGAKLGAPSGAPTAVTAL